MPNPVVNRRTLGKKLVFPGDGDFDSYVNGAFLSGLGVRSSQFADVWVDSPFYLGIVDVASLDVFTDGVPVAGLDAEQFWAGTWIDGDIFLGLHGLESADGYSDGVALAGLAGGTEWGGAWVD